MKPDYEIELIFENYNTSVTFREVRSGVSYTVYQETRYNGNEEEFRDSSVFNDMLNEAKLEVAEMLEVVQKLEINNNELMGIK